MADATPGASSENALREVDLGTGRKPLLLETSWGVGIGGSLWTTGSQLVQHLVQHEQFYRRIFADARVLELGAGTGLAGLAVAAIFRPQEVVLTDLTSHLGILRENVELNAEAIKAAARAEDLKDTADVVRVAEFKDTAEVVRVAASKDTAGVVRVAEYAWGTDSAHLRPPFDVVLGTDVAYFEELHEPLVKALLAVTNEDTLVVLGVTRFDTGPAFFKRLDKAGFEHYQIAPSAFDEEFRQGAFGLFTAFRRRPWDGRPLDNFQEGNGRNLPH